MNTAIIQDLLRERRSIALELHRETDPIAREYLEWELRRYDNEIERAQRQRRRMNAAADRGARRRR